MESFCANVFSIFGSWREFKCGEESSVLPETFMRGIAQALGGAWWLLRHFLKNFFAVLRLRSAISFDAVRLLAKQARERQRTPGHSDPTPVAPNFKKSDGCRFCGKFSEMVVVTGGGMRPNDK